MRTQGFFFHAQDLTGNFLKSLTIGAQIVILTIGKRRDLLPGLFLQSGRDDMPARSFFNSIFVTGYAAESVYRQRSIRLIDDDPSYSLLGMASYRLRGLHRPDHMIIYFCSEG
jgi:hypothetical protein